MTTTQVISDKFNVWAEIEGVDGPVDVLAVTIVWGINQIPTAEINLPVGFKLYSNKTNTKTNDQSNVKNIIDIDRAREQAKIEEQNNKEQTDSAVLAKLPQITIKAKINTNYRPERFKNTNNIGGPLVEKAKEKITDIYNIEQTLFTGYITGFTQNISSNNISWVITAKHKLSDLFYSSVSTASRLAAEFYSRKLPAFNSASQTGVFAGNKQLTFINTIYRHLNKHRNNLVKGLINALYAVFKNANKVRKIIPACPLSDVTKIIEEALNNIITQKEWRGIKKNKYSLSGYIPITLNKIIQTQLRSYAELISEIIEQGGRFDDMWSNLVMRTLPLAELCFIPGITDAIIVPRLPMIKKPGIILERHEIIQISVSSSYQQRLRAVSVIGASTASMTGVVGTSMEGKLVGCYMPIKNMIGKIHAVEPAPWLQKIVKHLPTPPNISTDRKEANAAFLGAVKEENNEDDKEDKIKNIQDLYTAYAKYVYNEENYAQKTGNITTIPRLDIAPGTTIKIVDTSPGIKEENRYLFAYVNQVMLNIRVNTEPPEAQTILILSHVRTSEENNKFAFNEHPLYQGNLFTGSTLYATSEKSPEPTIQL